MVKSAKKKVPMMSLLRANIFIDKPRRHSSVSIYRRPAEIETQRVETIPNTLVHTNKALFLDNKSARDNLFIKDFVKNTEASLMG